MKELKFAVDFPKRDIKPENNPKQNKQQQNRN